MDAFKKGLAEVVPQALLQLFSWRELEMALCGRPDVDLELLKRNTEYEGYSESSSLIKTFWKVMESFTNEEQALFLKFVWGRSALPSLTSEFTQKFRIQTFSKDDNQEEAERHPDKFLPESRILMIFYFSHIIL